MIQFRSLRTLNALARMVLCVAVCAPTLPAQLPAISEPNHEELLNGLKILMWQLNGAQDVTLKLRIHSGAAFDLVGKSGEMALLGDVLFPDPATIEFFTEMGGKLDVNTDHDSMTITLQGRANELERMVEILRNALLTPQITPDIVARQRDRRIKILKDTAISPTIVADRAIAVRLFGDFPYGRPASGTAEDLGRVERADLLQARDRFLNPNNATLAIIGGIDRNRTMRALRQLLGSWRKSEQIVPSTFRQPERPDPRTLIINGPADQTAELRLATRGVAKADSDYNAVEALALVARQRWQELAPELAGKQFYVRAEAHLLPGQFVFGASIDSKSTAAVIGSAKKVIESLEKDEPTASEVGQARNELVVEARNRLGKPETMSDFWLDAETFRLASVNDRIQSLKMVSAHDVRRVALRLFKDQPVASIVLGNAEQLKGQLVGRIDTEVMGEIPGPGTLNPAKSPAPKPITVSKP
ncbi:MAG TPA: pitrilysin family protein [Pyrinomonadaceae bacterium]